MTSNDVLRRLRYALNLSNGRMVELFRLGGEELRQAQVISFLKKEGEDGYVECEPRILGSFLDGLIVKRRGMDESKPALQSGPLSNNAILKKIRVALQLKDSDIVDILSLAHVRLSKSEINAMFRAEGHENYKPCGDQVLRNFLRGLTVRYRDAGGDGGSTKDGANGSGMPEAGE